MRFKKFLCCWKPLALATDFQCNGLYRRSCSGIDRCFKNPGKSSFLYIKPVSGMNGVPMQYGVENANPLKAIYLRYLRVMANF